VHIVRRRIWSKTFRRNATAQLESAQQSKASMLGVHDCYKGKRGNVAQEVATEPLEVPVLETDSFGALSFDAHVFG